MDELIQKDGFSFRKHTLYKNKIVVESKNLKINEKYEVKLDTIGFELHYQADSTLGKTTFIICCIGLPILMIVLELVFHNIGLKNILVVSACTGLLLLLGFLKQKNDNIWLMGGEKNLYFFRDAPDEKTVLEFIDKVIVAAKNNIKEKYLNEDGEMYEGEYISNLAWLKDKGIITKAEYENYKADFNLKRLL